MMNDMIKDLFERKSVRVFENKPIEDEKKQWILEAAAQAPTAGNQQLYTILDITDNDMKKQLVETCDHQPFIATAPMVLIFCADCKKWYDAFKDAKCQPRKPAVGDLFLAIDDALIAAQNAVVAAQSLGIGSCYIGDIMENCEAQKALLHLPKYVFPAAMLVFGYPTKQQQERIKPQRIPMEYLVHENGYHELDSEQLKSMFANKTINTSYEQWMQAFCNRKYNSDFSKEMSRSVAQYLKDFTE